MSGADECLFVKPSRRQAKAKAAPSAAVQRKRTQAERRCRDDRVERTLTEHFADFPVSVKEHRLIDGKSLRQRVADIIFPDSKTANAKRLSPQQIAALRLEFAVGDIAEAMLLDRADDGPVMSKRFDDASAMASHRQSNKRNRGPLAAVLRTTTKVNLREVKALLRVCTPLRASASARN